LLLALLGTAEASNWGKARPYVRPVLSGGVISINGRTHAQATGGAVAGVTIRDRADPHWFSHTRGLATGTYGITSGSLGAQARVGSFIGPDGKLFRYQIGPDIFFDGYGQRGAEDFYLPWSPGVDIMNSLLVKLSKPLVLQGTLVPGWVFVPERQAQSVKPFHQLTASAVAVLRTDALRLTVGWQRSYNRAGVVDALILSGAI
jgi:hypothetical protein